ncbi:hypothetical protein EVAR_93707_1 [Eumeta japonica]|uniref:Uncharacterized protein n=1 Tax=Eumeta variegata TaxID=151549 RepID=A0A4C1U2J2_EUMVA|nr:hypothetical protein EVAR_93707_1 [Eumeta japonica]
MKTFVDDRKRKITTRGEHPYGGEANIRHRIGEYECLLREKHQSLEQSLEDSGDDTKDKNERCGLSPRRLDRIRIPMCLMRSLARELRSVSEDGVPPQPTVLYYGAEVEIGTGFGFLEISKSKIILAIWVGNGQIKTVGERKRWICAFNLECVGRGGFHTTHDYPQSLGLDQEMLTSLRITDTFGTVLLEKTTRLLLEAESSKPRE